MNKQLYSAIRSIFRVMGLKGASLSLIALILTLAIGLALQNIEQGSPDVAGLSAESYTVIGVVDGDTLKVDIDPGIAEKIETIRLIGIDAPELAKVRIAAECMANESTQKLRQLIGTSNVQLQADGTQTDRDRYGRLLRYVFIDDRNLNQQMVEAGMAREYTYDKAYIYQAQFRAAQQQAQVAELSIWSQMCVGS